MGFLLPGFGEFGERNWRKRGEEMELDTFLRNGSQGNGCIGMTCRKGVGIWDGWPDPWIGILEANYCLSNVKRPPWRRSEGKVEYRTFIFLCWTIVHIVHIISFRKIEPSESFISL